MILGLVGKYGSGKDSAADILKEYGFKHYSLSDEIRRELKKNGIRETREALIAMGNMLRKNQGNGVLAKRALMTLSKEKYATITSIRNLGEVKELRKHNKFKLLFIDAPQQMRYERVKDRFRQGDVNDFEQFKKLEEKESKGKGNEQQLDKVIEQADMVLNNDKDLAELKSKIKKLLLDLGIKPIYKRPSWDEYFMEVMEAISKRATCDRGRSGCVIAKDKQLLATGYVGSPIGLPHCDEVGHQMKKMLHEDGSVTEHCVRTIHAEQNAICQAAKQGISIQGGTLYCRMTPCRVCAMIIINSGIKRVVCQRKYHAGQESEYMFKMAKVQLDYFFDEVQEYEKT